MSNFERIMIPGDTRGILMDLDNTCYQYEPCHAKAIHTAQKVAEDKLGLIPDFTARYNEAQKITKSRAPGQAASHSRLHYFHELVNGIDPTQAVSLALALEDIYWATFIKSMQPLPGLYDFLDNMTARKIPVVVVTDLTTQLQFKKIVALDLESRINGVVTSEMAGVEKPHPAIFTLGLRKLGFKPMEVVMIGDDLKKDIAGASAIGIHTIHIVHENN